MFLIDPETGKINQGNPAASEFYGYTIEELENMELSNILDMDEDEVMEENREAIIIIHDNGPGIPAEIQSQVFIPFFTTKPGGSGIGMSIVKKIVLMSGGIIDFYSLPGGGTKFVVKLPES